MYNNLNQKLSDHEIDIQINKKQKAFKKFLSPELNLRSIPKIKFYNDKKFFYQDQIDNLLNKSVLNKIRFEWFTWINL